MLYGIIADIHGNLEALQSVMQFLRKIKPDKYICAGDIVGYGPNPNECAKTVMGLWPFMGVLGNHDWASCGMRDISYFNSHAVESINWTRNVLTEINQMYISELPKAVSDENISVYHGSPRDQLDEYLITREQYKENIKFLKTRITIVGHTHKPMIFSDKRILTLDQDLQTIVFDADENNIIINPGSVGQPRDGNNKASCALYNTEKNELTVARIEYDIAATQNKMRHERMAALLIERLSVGK